MLSYPASFPFPSVSTSFCIYCPVSFLPIIPNLPQGSPPYHHRTYNKHSVNNCWGNECLCFLINQPLVAVLTSFTAPVGRWGILITESSGYFFQPLFYQTALHCGWPCCLSFHTLHFLEFCIFCPSTFSSPLSRNPNAQGVSSAFFMPHLPIFPKWSYPLSVLWVPKYLRPVQDSIKPQKCVSTCLLGRYLLHIGWMNEAPISSHLTTTMSKKKSSFPSNPLLLFFCFLFWLMVVLRI